MRKRAKGFVTLLFAAPLLRRIGYHISVVTRNVDRTFFIRLFAGLFSIVLIAALLVTVAEGPRGSVGEFFETLGDSFYWGITTVMGAGNSAYVTTPVGYVISWLLVLFGVAIVATITGAFVGFLIDFLLKEGQGMGAAGYRDHIVVCGWNSTARELIAELAGDDYDTKIVLLSEGDKNPAGNGVYYVNGDVTNADDLRRAGIEEAMAAVICPADASNEADMRSILSRDGDRGDRPAGAHRGGGQQPGPCRALPAGQGRRDHGDLADRLAAAGPVLALPRPRRAGHRHRVGRRGLGALPRQSARQLHRPLDRRALDQAACRTTPRPCWRSGAVAARS